MDLLDRVDAELAKPCSLQKGGWANRMRKQRALLDELREAFLAAFGRGLVDAERLDMIHSIALPPNPAFIDREMLCQKAIAALS